MGIAGRVRKNSRTFMSTHLGRYSVMLSGLKIRFMLISNGYAIDVSMMGMETRTNSTVRGDSLNILDVAKSVVPLRRIAADVVQIAADERGKIWSAFQELVRDWWM